MSAAAARRRKQLAAKAQLASGEDPITTKLNSLLSKSSEEELPESTAYEALQLAQSQVRKSVINGNYAKATGTYGYDIVVKLLSENKASVASQLMTLLVQVLNETHATCDEGWITKIQNLSDLNLKAIDTLKEKNQVEYQRLMKLHAKFLKSVLAWSDALGSFRFGHLEVHKLLAEQLWTLSETQADKEVTDDQESGENAETADEDFTKVGLQTEAITHYALAEDTSSILLKLKTLPDPTKDETAQHHTCPPCAREALLTRAILIMLSIENIRDATSLLADYVSNVESRDLEALKKSYMSKTDGKAPSHPIFLSMMVEICRKNASSGPLYTWAIKSFNVELDKMYKSDILKMYTNNIGKVYFNILPPPSMMSTIENMMSMMGGGGMGGGMPAGGINPAMMQAMMGGMGGM